MQDKDLSYRLNVTAHRCVRVEPMVIHPSFP
jgi:hypothetical protein